MPNPQPPASGTRQKSISQGMPPGDPAQRAQINNVPLGQVPLSPNALLGASQAAAQGAPQQPQQANPMTAALAQGHRNMTPQQRAKAEDRADWQVHAFGTLSRKPDLTYQDVISMAAQSVVDKKATPQEASAAIAHLPQNPTQLRQVIKQHFVAAIINASLLSGSRQQAAPQQGAPSAPQTGAPGMQPQSQAPVGGFS